MKRFSSYTPAILLIFVLIFFSNTQTVSAQISETVVVGQVLSRTDRTPLANVNIYFKNSTVATHTNEEGYFLIRTYEKYSTLIFSYLGFRQEQIHIRPGQSIGIEVTMKEMDNQLQEIFVLPGTNPALDMMRRMRVLRAKNDKTNLVDFKAEVKEQNLILLSKVQQQFFGKRIYNQLKKGNLLKSDTSLLLPVYMGDRKLLQQGKVKRELAQNTYKTSGSSQLIVQKMVGGISTDLNFYNNSVSVFGKSMISPLAAIGGAFYDYYIADSLSKAGVAKQYLLHFFSKNKKNLAFNGKMWVDSASLALVSIEAELPDQANINFIHNLKIVQKFKAVSNGFWVPQNQSLTLSMNYMLLADSANHVPEVFVRHTSLYDYSDSIQVLAANFASTDYDTLTLNDKLEQLGNTPIIRTAKWIADAALTGYMKFGHIDVGTIPLLARATNQEGFRLTLPMKTNETLWKDVSLGGYVGYGFKNKVVRYSTTAQVMIPGSKRRNEISARYTDDIRRIDYNYNDFINTENPLNTGDEDMFSTLLSFWSADKLNRRKEAELSYAFDWSKNIESTIYSRSLQFYSNSVFPLISTKTSENLSSMRVNSFTFSTRFSFNEMKYRDHVQRIYISNDLPVLYTIFEAGHYKLSTNNGYYGKAIALVRQVKHTDLGLLEYTAQLGTVIGSVPYPILQYSQGTEAGGYGLNQLTPGPVTGSGGYSLAHFNMMKYMEYGADTYFDLHSQFITNGLILNQIPFVKHLNFREVVSFKMAYGTLSHRHSDIIEYPAYIQGYKRPYFEVGVGLTNILRIFSLQSVWRLTDLDHQNVKPWGIRLGISISF